MVDRPDWGDGGRSLVPQQGGLPAATHDDFGGYSGGGLPVANVLGGRGLPTIEDVQFNLPPALVVNWVRDPAGENYRLRVTQQAALALASELSPGAASELVGGFDSLPQGAQAAILGELSLGSVGSVRNATEDDVAQFRRSDVGRIVADGWGGRAPRNVAKVWQRTRRMVDGMSPNDVDAAIDYFESLPTGAAAAILRFLAR